jgi:hypothetical protein
MKSIQKIITGSFIYLLLSTSLLADPALVKSVELTINPVQLTNGKLPLSLRIALGRKMAVGFHFQGRFFTYGTSPLHGLGGGLSLKFYLNGQAISDSWYIEPSVMTDFSKSSGQSFWGITPTLIAGHTWVWASGLVINLGIGASYSHNFVTSSYWDSNTPYGIQGLMGTGEFSIGYAW